MKLHNLLWVRMAALAVCASLILACGSNPTNTNAPSVTPANDATATPANTNTANTNAAAPGQQPAQAGAAKPDCGACWVHIFDDKGLDATDDNHMICGPGKWPSLRNMPGAVKINWSDEIESLKVGPGATVTVWIGEQFTGTSHTFTAGSETLTLKTIPNLSDNISSLEIKCQ